MAPFDADASVTELLQRYSGGDSAVAESLFRKESGRIIATLIRISGSFDQAEEALQEAFASALASWPETGLPQNPAAWITAAAHRKLIDQSRREKTRLEKHDSLQYVLDRFRSAGEHSHDSQHDHHWLELLLSSASATSVRLHTMRKLRGAI